MTAEDRLATGYEPKFDLDYEVGQQGELYSARIIDSLKSGTRVEVKTDEMAQQTGNVYVEYECQYRGEWKPSGIATTEAEIWCFIVGEAAVYAQTDRLKDVVRFLWRFPSARKSCKRGTHPTHGIVIPLTNLIKMLAYGPPKVEQTQAPFGRRDPV